MVQREMELRRRGGHGRPSQSVHLLVHDEGNDKTPGRVRGPLHPRRRSLGAPARPGAMIGARSSECLGLPVRLSGFYPPRRGSFPIQEALKAASWCFSSLSSRANALCRSAASIAPTSAGVKSNSAGNCAPQKLHSLFLRLRIERLHAGH
jgi:hypothetical protein